MGGSRMTREEAEKALEEVCKNTQNEKRLRNGLECGLQIKLENDIGIKTFVDNYKYCRSCGPRMLGVVEFRVK